MKLPELIDYLIEIVGEKEENENFDVGICFEEEDVDGLVTVVSKDLEGLIMCEENGVVALHFVAAPAYREALKIAETVQAYIDDEEFEEDPDAEDGLAF